MKETSRILVGLLLIGGFIACTNAAVAQIQVTGAVPNNATQGTINLDVVVKGNGFKKGAIAQWLVSGTTNPGGVTVNSTAFNSSTQLTANITVASDAAIGGFDIVVKNSDGRSGKGTELFAVNASSSKSTCVAPPPIDPVVNACTSATAQTSCLDSNFGTGGFVSTNVAVTVNGAVQATVIRQQSDGKLVAAGYSTNTVTVVRYGIDGTLDSSFGNGGITQYSFPGSPTTGVYDAVVDANNNVLIAGFEARNEYVLRITSAGVLDSSFGSGGAYIRAGNSKQAFVGFGLAVQSDGKILVAGADQGTNVSYGSLVRLNSNGTSDNTFGSGGIVTLSSGSGVFYAPVIQTVGNTNYILVGGQVGKANSFGLLRFTSSGGLDSTFGTSGQATISFCGNAGRVNSLALDSSGNILAAGSTSFGGPNLLVVARFSSYGALDTTFGDASTGSSARTGSTLLSVFAGNTNPGFRTTMTPVTDTLGNTHILAAGTGGSSSSAYFVLARYNSDGTLDNTFGGPGVVAANGGIGSNFGYGVLVQSNGEIVEVGSSQLSSGVYNFALVRFWP